MNRKELESQFIDTLNSIAVPNHVKRQLVTLFLAALEHKEPTKKRVNK